MAKKKIHILNWLITLMVWLLIVVLVDTIVIVNDNKLNYILNLILAFAIIEPIKWSVGVLLKVIK